MDEDCLHQRTCHPREKNGFHNAEKWGSDLYREHIGLFKQPCWLIKWEQCDLSIQDQCLNPRLQPFISWGAWKKIWSSSSVASLYLCNDSVWAAHSHYTEEASGRKPAEAERWSFCCQIRTWSVFMKGKRQLCNPASALRIELRCTEMVTSKLLTWRLFLRQGKPQLAYLNIPSQVFNLQLITR